MSDLEEMVKDLSRAIELMDLGAANRIFSEMTEEIHRYELGDIAEHLHSSLLRGDIAEATIYASTLGSRAGQIDAAASLAGYDSFDFAGATVIRNNQEAFRSALGLVRQATTAYERRN